jgi:putative ABC transport system permease protein
MTPNFYMMLSPDLLSSVPSGYLTSFYLPGSREQALTDLIRSYPGVTFLDTRFLLSQLQALVARISLAVELILAFVLVGAVLVMLSILLTTTRERLMQGAVLRTLGAARSQLQRAQWTEFALLGLMSALASLVGAELLIAGLYTLVLDITYQGPGLYWLVLPPVVALTLAILGSLMLRPVVTVPPLEVLRRG